MDRTGRLSNLKLRKVSFPALIECLVQGVERSLLGTAATGWRQIIGQEFALLSQVQVRIYSTKSFNFYFDYFYVLSLCDAINCLYLDIPFCKFYTQLFPHHVQCQYVSSEKAVMTIVYCTDGIDILCSSVLTLHVFLNPLSVKTEPHIIHIGILLQGALFGCAF